MRDAQAKASGRPLLIGLSGPIGCGKSTVGRMLTQAGGRLIDADDLAREVTADGEEALADIRRRFGDTVFNGAELDRAALASLVFVDAAALRDLEAIVHPRVRRRVEAELVRAREDGVSLVALEAIKLVEGGLAERCDEVWIVDCAPEVQRARLAARGMPAADVARRLAAQGDDMSGRLARLLEGRVATRFVSTAGTLDETRRLVTAALEEAVTRYRGG